MLMEGIVSFLSKMFPWLKAIKLRRFHAKTLKRFRHFPCHAMKNQALQIMPHI